MRFRCLFALACAVLGAAPALAQGSWGAIGLAWDPAGLECNWEQIPGREGVLYVLAYPYGLLADGTTGAEFRVDGFPSDWSVISVTPNPVTVALVGNPLAEGCNIAFTSCQTETSGVVVLYSIRFGRLGPSDAAGAHGPEPHRPEQFLASMSLSLDL